MYQKNWGEQRTHDSVSTEAVKDWNSLDLRLRKSNNLESFKRDFQCC